MFRQKTEFFKTYNNTKGAKDMASKLKKTYNFPKMCASASINITDGGDYIEYYRGQNAMTYKVS
jgi:hypothetical protein